MHNSKGQLLGSFGTTGRANVDFRNMIFLDFSTEQMDPCTTLRTLNHRPASKWSTTEAGHQIPRFII